MSRMRKIVPALLLAVAACVSPPTEPPEGETTDWVNPEYKDIRPVIIAVLPVHAPRLDMASDIRRHVTNELIRRSYSPLSNEAVDARVGPDGLFKGGELDYDGTLEIRLTKWEPAAGVDRFAASGTARLQYKNGDILWKCEFNDELFPVDETATGIDVGPASRAIARHVVSRMPARPELPPE